MALSKHGKLIGRAAHIERVEIQNQIEEVQHRFNVLMTVAVNRLAELDPNWEKWIDSCPQQTCGELLPVMLEYIELLETRNWLADEAHYVQA